MSKTTAFLFAIAMLFSPASDVIGQEQNGLDTRFVLTLNDSLINSLKSLGSLRSPLVNPDDQGKISAVEIRLATAADNDPVAVAAPVVFIGNALQIQLNDQLLEQVANQPVRIAIPSMRQFERVFLAYEVSASVRSNLPSSSESTAPIGNNGTVDNPVYYQHFVKLTGSEDIQGQMDLSDTIRFDTRFGEVDIAIEQIAGVRFHIDGNDSAIVVLKNGDSITGIPSTEMFNLNTDWGRAELNPIYVEAITTSANAVFRQNNDVGFGPRWQLIQSNR